MRTLPADELRDEFESAVENLEATDETFVRAGKGANADVQLIDYSIDEAIKFGKSLDVSTFYGTLEEAADGSPQGLAFSSFTIV